MRTALATFMIVLGLSCPTAAQDDGDARLEAIREAIMSARFSEALDGAREYLSRTDLRAADRNAGLELLAIAQIANRQSADAERTLALLYSRDPAHRLSDADASPPVLSAFARARQSRPAQVTVRLEHEPPAMSRREPPTIEVRIPEGADAVAEVRLVYRMGNEGASRVVMTERADGSYIARIPVVGDAHSATDVAYHVIALAPSLTELASVASAAEPMQLRIPPERIESPPESTVSTPTAEPSTPRATPAPSASIVEEWWFWTLIVVLVAGAAVTTGILLGPAQEGPEQGTFGSVRLMTIELP